MPSQHAEVNTPKQIFFRLGVQQYHSLVSCMLGSRNVGLGCLSGEHMVQTAVFRVAELRVKIVRLPANFCGPDNPNPIVTITYMRDMELLLKYWRESRILSYRG